MTSQEMAAGRAGQNQHPVVHFGPWERCGGLGGGLYPAVVLHRLTIIR